MVEWTITVLNFMYAVCGAVLALFFMLLGYKLFDRVTPFDTGAELSRGNVAVGVVVGAIFVGLGLSVGLVVGMGLN